MAREAVQGMAEGAPEWTGAGYSVQPMRHQVRWRHAGQRIRWGYRRAGSHAVKGRKRRPRSTRLVRLRAPQDLHDTTTVPASRGPVEYRA